MTLERLGYRKEFLRHFITTAIIGVATFFIVREVLRYRREFSMLFEQADYTMVLFLFILQVLSFLLNAAVSTLLFKAVKVKANFTTNLIIAIGNKLGTKLMPVMGGIVAGFYSYKKMLNLSTGTAVFLIMAWTSFQIAAYAVIVVVSAYFLPKEIVDKWPALTSALTFLFFLGIGIAFLLLRNKGQVIARILRRGISFLNGVWRRFLKRPFSSPEKVEVALQQVAEGMGIMSANKYRVMAPLALSIIFYLMDITILYFSFSTFGYVANYAVIVLAFVLGAALALFDPAAGSPGVSEAAYILAFVVMGIPAHVALLAVLLFRIVTYWLWVPFSFVYFIRLQRRASL